MSDLKATRPIAALIDNGNVTDLHSTTDIIYVGAGFDGTYMERDQRRYVFNGIDAVMWAWKRAANPFDTTALGFNPEIGKPLTLYVGAMKPLNILAAYLFEHPHRTEKRLMHALLGRLSVGAKLQGDQQTLITSLTRFESASVENRTRKHLLKAFEVIDAFVNEDEQFVHVAAGHVRPTSNAMPVVRSTPANAHEPLSYREKTPFNT